jgi:putative integral membrane protein (TIGR02587 family)
MVVAIGVSVGTAQLGSGPDSPVSDSQQKEKLEQQQHKQQQERLPQVQPHHVGQLVIAFCGAVLIAANVAPTEEIVMLGVEISHWKLVGLVLLSISFNAVILFYSGFRGAQQFVGKSGAVGVVMGAVITYAIALMTSASLCWFFGHLDGAGLSISLAQTVVLGLPATIGASAGRLLLQQVEQ